MIQCSISVVFSFDMYYIDCALCFFFLYTNISASSLLYIRGLTGTKIALYVFQGAPPWSRQNIITTRYCLDKLVSYSVHIIT